MARTDPFRFMPHVQFVSPAVSFTTTPRPSSDFDWAAKAEKPVEAAMLPEVGCACMHARTE